MTDESLLKNIGTIGQLLIISKPEQEYFFDAIIIKDLLNAEIEQALTLMKISSRKKICIRYGTNTSPFPRYEEQFPSY